MNKPILITGSQRSGTTWTEKMLGLSKETGYIHEPFDIDLNSGCSKLKLTHWFPYIPTNDVDGLKDEMEHVLQLLTRQPASFVSRLNKLSWQFPFNRFLEQDVLMDTYLYPFRVEIEHFSANEKSTFEQVILLWRIIYRVVNKYREKYPHWIFLRHEDLAVNPNEDFKILYQKVGLDYTNNVENKIKKSNQSKNLGEVHNSHNVKRSSKSQIDAFKKRLTGKEITYIKGKTSDACSYFSPMKTGNLLSFDIQYCFCKGWI